MHRMHPIRRPDPPDDPPHPAGARAHERRTSASAQRDSSGLRRSETPIRLRPCHEAAAGSIGAQWLSIRRKPDPDTAMSAALRALGGQGSNLQRPAPKAGQGGPSDAAQCVHLRFCDLSSSWCLVRVHRGGRHVNKRLTHCRERGVSGVRPGLIEIDPLWPRRGDDSGIVSEVGNASGSRVAAHADVGRCMGANARTSFGTRGDDGGLPRDPNGGGSVEVAVASPWRRSPGARRRASAVAPALGVAGPVASFGTDGSIVVVVVGRFGSGRAIDLVGEPLLGILASLEVAARVDDDRCAAWVTGAVFRRRATRVSPTCLSAARSSLVLSPADSCRVIRGGRRRRFRPGWPGCSCRFARGGRFSSCRFVRGGRFSRSGRPGRRRRLDRNRPVVVAENDETDDQRSAQRTCCQSDQQMPLLAGHAFGCHWTSSLCVPAAVSRSRAKVAALVARHPDRRLTAVPR
jgi:hypothetical protein